MRSDANPTFYVKILDIHVGMPDAEMYFNQVNFLNNINKQNFDNCQLTVGEINSTWMLNARHDGFSRTLQVTSSTQCQVLPMPWWFFQLAWAWRRKKKWKKGRTLWVIPVPEASWTLDRRVIVHRRSVWAAAASTADWCPGGCLYPPALNPLSATTSAADVVESRMDEQPSLETLADGKVTPLSRRVLSILSIAQVSSANI